ncbi:tetratricopeptide repeat protein [Candidatus Odyssella acanthamoebae]|uniref:Uncharacterized protein n=1 Tax=Candidatus Odyssella acanthamoebae TaxID=91604 RepID=A0A077AVG8_9PROT|nr:sel1 repeat family protein [Candidatus Paracaedibacter acanthamoebae]AIK95648.1 hypothetical protein ID47_01180 [Candidatus Paracaedibacter acanthamoebae]
MKKTRSFILLSLLCATTLCAYSMDSSLAGEASLEENRNRDVIRLKVKGMPIPSYPQEALLGAPLTPVSAEAEFQRGQALEQEGTSDSLAEAAQAYLAAGMNGHTPAFIRLGYMYEGGRLLPATAVEEFRFKDALAAYYIERGGSPEDPMGGFFFTTALPEDEETFDDGAGAAAGDHPTDRPLASLSDIQDDPALSIEEKFFKMGMWYEAAHRPGETIAQRRLRFAYAARFYEQSALWRFYPYAYTSLGHMYYFGKGIDISDSSSMASARLLAQEYYAKGADDDLNDPVAQFMMGFLLEQEKTEEADTQAQIYYQSAASYGYQPACFRLGVRCEQGQEDMSTPEKRQAAYAQAKDYYERVQAQGSEILPLIAQLINLPKDLSPQIARITLLKDQEASLQNPAYALTEYGFCKYLQSQLPSSLLPHWIHMSLTQYALTHGLSYNQNIMETAERVKSIVGLFSSSGQTYVIPGLNAHEQKDLAIQSSKILLNTAHAHQMRQMQLGQYLGQEDLKWKEKTSPDQGAPTHVEAWVSAITPLVKALHEASSPFDGQVFLPTLLSRLTQASASTLLLAADRAIPEGYIEKFNTPLLLIEEEAQGIFKKLKPYQRTLAQQIAFYKNLQDIKNHTGLPFSKALLGDIALARHLMKEANHEDTQENIIKHFQSALALKAYAEQKQLSLLEVKAELDEKARQIMAILSPQLHDFSGIGYHILQNLTGQTSERDAATEIARHYREKLIVTLTQDNLDNDWTNLEDLDPSYVSGSEEEEAAALTKLYDQTVNYIAQAEAALPQDQPHLNLKAVTYEDPALGIYGPIVYESLKDIQAQARELYQSGVIGDSEQEIYESLLNENIHSIRNLIAGLSLGNINMRAIDHIIDTLEGEDQGIAQKIDRKQNLLFMLRKSADWENGEDEKRLLAYTTLVGGTKGRCADGQATFFQEWVLEYVMNHLHEINVSHAPSITDMTLKIRLSILLQDYKRAFIEKHASPFLIGHAVHMGAYEDQTAMKTLLTQMMRLPLSLTGSYSRVLYPSFAIRHLEKPETTIQMKAVMDRFLNGGKIVYKDMRTTTSASGELIYHDKDEDDTPEPYRAEVSFDGMSLKTLSQEIRSALVDLKREQLVSEPLPGLVSAPRLTFVLGEAVVKDFLQHDPVIASFYSTFVQSNYSQGNIFFDHKAAFEKGTHLRYILRDAAILRLMEVTGYAIVPAGFYEGIPQSWKF